MFSNSKENEENLKKSGADRSAHPVLYLNGVVVLYGLCDREVSLQGEDDRHEDGGQDGDALDLVAGIRKDVFSSKALFFVRA